MEIQAERGYLIPAIDTDTVDYVSCANQLAHSIREWHPDANITILTQDMLPFGDRGGFANDWQCFYASPYRQTIKLEADMIAAGPVDHWWTMLEKRDVVISQGCRTFYDEPAVSRYYRKTFDNNALPDVYNAITYWRLSELAKEFFDLVRNIFENWELWRTVLKFGDLEATTDVVYAMAAQVIGPENVTLPKGYGPTMVHMKQHIQSTHSNNWTNELVWEATHPGFRIQTVSQHGFVHYHDKEWRYT